MIASRQRFLSALFAGEHACIAYLFQKRWPGGFSCPFCGRMQKEISPASTVICRYCRKQTSITSRTLMHGSKKNLVSWMRVAWQFCSRNEGISAREIQRIMSLSSYQTAWRWLRILRNGAAIAESSPCSGLVLLDVTPLPVAGFPTGISPAFGMALELDKTGTAAVRVLFAAGESASPAALAAELEMLVDAEATILLSPGRSQWLEYVHDKQRCRRAGREQLEQGQTVLRQTALWLTTIYRGAVDDGNLQSYLGEFSFRYNTRSWPDRLMVMDHLLTGLVSTGCPENQLLPGDQEGGFR